MGRTIPPASDAASAEQLEPAAVGASNASAAWLPGIEALRGVAALSVVAHHCWSLSDQRRFPGYQIIEGFGSWGVNLFFLLSGFLLAEYFWRPRGSWGLCEYYVRRFFRIAPAYYANLLILFLFFADHNQLFSRMGLRQVVANVTFTQWLSPGTASNLNVNGTLWTLTLEVMLYIVMPVLALAIRWRPLIAGSVLVLASVGYRLVVALSGDGLAEAAFGTGGPPDEIKRLYLVRQFPGILAIFVIGVGSRWAYLRWLERRPTTPERVSLPVLVLLLVPSVLLLFRVERASSFRHWIWFVAFDLAVVVLALPALAYAALPVRAAMQRSMAVATWFGERSYGIYLWHFPVILSLYGRGVHGTPPTLTHWWARIAIIVTVSVALGTASYVMIERPAREWGRRLSMHLAQRRSSPTPRGGPT